MIFVPIVHDVHKINLSCLWINKLLIYSEGKNTGVKIMRILSTGICLVLLSLNICFAWSEENQENIISQDQVLLNLRQEHPRLMLTDERLAELKQLYETDSNLQGLIRNSIEQAERTIKKPQLVYQKRGPRLLHVSRDCLDRVYDLGLAWRWTGDERYAKALKENLLAVCAFPDWNPSHYLDTAEMAHAVGVGYDWLYHWLDEESRLKIRQGLIRHGMEEGVNVYNGKGHWFTRKREQLESGLQQWNDYWCVGHSRE